MITLYTPKQILRSRNKATLLQQSLVTQVVSKTSFYAEYQPNMGNTNDKGALRWNIKVGLCTSALSSLIIVVLNSPDYVFL